MLPTLTGLCGDAAVGEGKEADGFGSAVPELGVCSAETSFLILERFPDRLCLLPPFFGLELSCPLLEVCCLQHAQQGKPARHQFSLCWRTCRPARVPSAFMRLAAAAAQLSPLASWMLPPGVGKVSPCLLRFGLPCFRSSSLSCSRTSVFGFRCLQTSALLLSC